MGVFFEENFIGQTLEARHFYGQFSFSVLLNAQLLLSGQNRGRGQKVKE